MTALYTQDLSAFSERIPSNLLKKAVDSVLGNPHPLFREIEKGDHIGAIKEASSFFSDMKTVIVFGTGGSSLGAKSLGELKRLPYSEPQTKVLFVDNIDPHSFDQLLVSLQPKETAFLVVSKSGSTAETLSQFLASLSLMKKKIPSQDLVRHFFLITEPGDSPLRSLGIQYGFKMLDHPTDVGGRFSVFICVGLLPAFLAGVDIEKVLLGAKETWHSFQNQQEKAPAALGASASVAYEKQGLGTSVIMPYCDRLSTFADWHRQLWAESLGKEGVGSLPSPALGTVDQHSQLQLYLEGPKDKFFTLIDVAYEGCSYGFDGEDLDMDSRLSYLKNRTLSHLMAAEHKATAQTLINHGSPVRRLSLPSLTEKNLGSLMVHFILETLVSAELLGVNALNQPAVEESKRLTREFLSQSRDISFSKKKLLNENKQKTRMASDVIIDNRANPLNKIVL
tara:strand:+ start:571 stop:1923 length:1353 start_codon:yes stop_codon:yes gene_type:complete